MPGEPFPPWMLQQIEDAKKKKGFFSSVFASTSAKKGSKVADASSVQGQTPEDAARDKKKGKGSEGGGVSRTQSLSGASLDEQAPRGKENCLVM